MASLPCTRTARCRPRKSGSSSFSTYLKTYALQVVHGRLFGMGQSKANQWMHVLLPVLLAALRTLGDAPTRSLSALAQRRRLRICALPQGPTGRRALVALHSNNVPPDEAVDPRLLSVAIPHRAW